MDKNQEFRNEVARNIQGLMGDAAVQNCSLDWIQKVASHKYCYNFSWLGRPIIQFPQDLVAMQELIWHVKPDLIIETGIAHGGSLILSSSILALLDLCDAIERGESIDPRVSRRRVLGIDIDIRAHNRAAIEAHPMSSRIQMLQGSSISPEMIGEVRSIAAGHERILVCLDSNHTHDHVLAELQGYAPLTSPGSYCVVLDTAIEDMPPEFFPDRPWGPGNSPMTAVQEFLRQTGDFVIDEAVHGKLLITAAPSGFLKRIK
ncbi:MAG: cephalosporin hydroxylase family protein [Chthoniobacterales bacterium]|nr:cephalosporin hydroxylase family protein [Chthoniobacterales bacterium]